MAEPTTPALSTTVAAYTSSFSAVGIGVWAQQNALSICGLIIAAATFWVNLHYKRKEDARNERRLALDFKKESP